MDGYLRIRIEITVILIRFFFLCSPSFQMCHELLPAGRCWRVRVITVTFQDPSHSIRMVINHGGNSVADWKHHLGAARGALPGMCQGAEGGKRRHSDGSAAQRADRGIRDMCWLWPESRNERVRLLGVCRAEVQRADVEVLVLEPLTEWGRKKDRI